jgi:hypothetical protein
MLYVIAQVHSISIALFVLSISLTVSAIEDCGHKLGFIPEVQFLEPKNAGGITNHTIVAKNSDGTVLAKIDYRLDNSDQKLFINYVTRDESVRNVGLPKAIFVKILAQYPNIHEVDANLMHVNALVIDRHLYRGTPPEVAVFLSPTGKMLYELGFKKILILKDYSFYLEGSYHLLVSK